MELWAHIECGEEVLVRWMISGRVWIGYQCLNSHFMILDIGLMDKSNGRCHSPIVKDFAYYLLRFPGALMGIFMFGVAFAPDIENLQGGITDLLIRLVVLIVGVYILLPNHRFLSAKMYKLRLYSLSLVGVAFIYFAVEMILDYRGGGKDFAMIPIAIFILYSAVALPASVWLRKRAPNA